MPPFVKYVISAFAAAALAGVFFGQMPAQDHTRLTDALRAHEVKVTNRWMGCRDPADLEKVRPLLTPFESMAARQFLEKARCRFLPVGQTARIEESSEWTASSCLRLDRETECLWFPTKLLQRVR